MFFLNVARKLCLKCFRPPIWPAWWIMFILKLNSQCRKCVICIWKSSWAKGPERVSVVKTVLIQYCTCLTLADTPWQHGPPPFPSSGPHSYHMYSPEEHQQRATVTAPLSSSLADFLSCWGVEKLPLPATISLRFPLSQGNSGTVYQHSPPGHRRVGQWDSGVWGERGGLLWLTVLIITVIGAGWGKWGVSSCFLNATTSTLHSGDTVRGEWGTGRTEGVKTIGREKREDG